MIFLIPIVDRMVKVSLRTVVMDVPPQDVITRNRVSFKENAVADFRKLIGATDPKEAAPGSIRRGLAPGKGENIVHGSDSPEIGKVEIGYFFGEEEIIETM